MCFDSSLKETSLHSSFKLRLLYLLQIVSNEISIMIRAKVFAQCDGEAMGEEWSGQFILLRLPNNLLIIPELEMVSHKTICCTSEF